MPFHVPKSKIGRVRGPGMLWCVGCSSRKKRAAGYKHNWFPFRMHTNNVETENPEARARFIAQGDKTTKRTYSYTYARHCRSAP